MRSIDSVFTQSLYNLFPCFFNPIFFSLNSSGCFDIFSAFSNFFSLSNFAYDFLSEFAFISSSAVIVSKVKFPLNVQ